MQKGRENDRDVSNATNKNKSNVADNKSRNWENPQLDQKIKLSTETETITNTQEVTEILISFFAGIAHELLLLNNSHFNCRMSQQKINYCPNTIFIFPVTETEVKRVTTSLKGKFSGGFDEIPEYLIKQCIQYIQQPLTYLYNVSLTQGIFADRLKVPKYNLFMQKGCLEL